MAKMHKMRVLNKSGDSAVTWLEDSPAEIAAAADEFLRLQGAGATMFAVADDKSTRRIDTFDPALAENEIVAIHAMTGGSR